MNIEIHGKNNKCNDEGTEDCVKFTRSKSTINTWKKNCTMPFAG